MQPIDRPARRCDGDTKSALRESISQLWEGVIALDIDSLDVTWGTRKPDEA